jgi:uncharacterized protein with ParB-like and HNH nuclease domain
MKYKDIPKLTRCGTYHCDLELEDLDHSITRYINEYDLQLNPDFQRGHVWTEAQQIAYVEFFIRGGMTGKVFYFNKPDWGVFNNVKDGDYNDMTCVDGLQRITALLKFVRGDLPAFGHYIPKKDVPEESRADDSKYFTDRTLRAFRDCNVEININNLKTKREVLAWYLEMNSGGTPHTKEELDKVEKMIKEEKK